MQAPDLDRAMTLEEYRAMSDGELERLVKEEYGDVPRRDRDGDDR